MAEGDYTPYGIPGLCSQWASWTSRLPPTLEKPAYRCTMVVEAFFGTYVVPGRLLTQPVRLVRSRRLMQSIRSREEFELSPVTVSGYLRPIFPAAAMMSARSASE